MLLPVEKKVLLVFKRLSDFVKNKGVGLKKVCFFIFQLFLHRKNVWLCGAGWCHRIFTFLSNENKNNLPLRVCVDTKKLSHLVFNHLSK